MARSAGNSLQEAALPPQRGQAGSHSPAARRISPGRTIMSHAPGLELLVRTDKREKGSPLHASRKAKRSPVDLHAELEGQPSRYHSRPVQKPVIEASFGSFIEPPLC